MNDCTADYPDDFLLILEAGRSSQPAHRYITFLEGLLYELHSAGYHEVEDYLARLWREDAEGDAVLGCVELLHFHYTAELGLRGAS